jgi:hypothetical protein
MLKNIFNDLKINLSFLANVLKVVKTNLKAWTRKTTNLTNLKSFKVQSWNNLEANLRGLKWSTWCKQFKDEL